MVRLKALRAAASCLVVAGLLFLVWTGVALGQIKHEIFLPNTDHELHIYRISGELPGKTLMIIGGIQGDEPGGYMTADLYADIHLKRGKLIVVPRANFYSILLNTRNGLTGDMNRKFTSDDENRKRNLEEDVVTILKELIAESDCLLNLHEGSGFYNPKWVSASENPLKYGQSLIFDAAEYTVPESGKVIDLKGLGQRVVGRVNQQISNSRYHFKLNNHNTLSSKSMHKEQRKSATYYALTAAHIPAFGVETSKSIKALATKISLHKLVVNSVMEELGIQLDNPRVVVEEPKLQYLLVKVNDGYPFALPDQAVLDVDLGDEVVVTDIIANYERGVVADIEGYGKTNDTKRQFRVGKPTRIVVRKDSEKFGWIQLEPRQLYAQVGKAPATPSDNTPPEENSAPVVKPEPEKVVAEKKETPVAIVKVPSIAAKKAEEKEMKLGHPVKLALPPVAELPVVAQTETVAEKTAAKPVVKPVEEKKAAGAELSGKTASSSVGAAIAAVNEKVALPAPQPKASQLIVDVNGKEIVVDASDTLKITKGARLTMQSIRTTVASLDNEIEVNFKGFTPPKAVNDGNDLMFPIYTDQDLWIKYSVDKKGKRYPIVAKYKEKTIGEFWVEID